jgi:hypothetical protein
MIPFTIRAKRTISFEVEIVAQFRIVVVQMLQILPIKVQRRVESLSVLVLVDNWGGVRWWHETLLCIEASLSLGRSDAGSCERHDASLSHTGYRVCCQSLHTSNAYRAIWYHLQLDRSEN